MPISVPGPPEESEPVSRDSSPSIYWLIPIVGIPALVLIAVLFGKVY